MEEHNVTLRALLFCAGLLVANPVRADDWVEVRAKAEDAVVFIESIRTKNDGTGAPMTSTGTGFIVSPHGYVITAGHVILDEQPETSVRTTARVRSRRTNITYDLMFLKKDPDFDVAVLLLPDTGWKNYLSFGDSTAVPKDTRLYTLGFPGASDLASADGLLSNKRGPRGHWQTTLPLNYGNSGGPVFEKSGKVVAIAAGGNDAQQGVTFAVPEAHARGMWQIAVAELRSQGQALAYRVASFVGGKEKVDNIYAVRQTSTVSIIRPQGMTANLHATSWKRYPDTERVDIAFEGPTNAKIAFTQVVSPHGSFITNMMGSEEVPTQQRDATRAQLRTDLFAVIKNIKNPKYTFEARGMAKVGDLNANVITIDANGTVVQWYVHAGTGRLLRAVARVGPMKEEAVIDYSDWKTFSGFRYPASSVMSHNGQKTGEVRVQDLQINPALSSGLFEKPQTASKPD